jgi:initiation factor 1A
MPVTRNLRGGKAFKKGKKPAAGTADKVDKFFGRDADQDYARAVTMLGNRRVRCFCNDGKERICKIRGSLCKGPKKQKIEVGDILLISYRVFEDANSDSDEDVSGNQVNIKETSQMADIMYKYSRYHLRDNRKEYGIHQRLFLAEEGEDGRDEMFDPDAKEEAPEEEEDVDIDAV